MKLIWHIVRKDMVRLRLSLGFLALIYATEYALGMRLLVGGVLDLYHFEEHQLLDIAACIVEWVLTYVLVASLIHEDPLVGTTAFWATRPISGGRLMAAKLASCCLMFLALPVALSLPWWIYCGYGLHELPPAILQTLGFELLPVGLALCLAVLTENLGRFTTATFILAGYAAAVLMRIAVSPRQGIELADGAVPIPPWLPWALGAALVAAVATHQFLTRRTGRSLVLLGIPLLAVVFAGPWISLGLRKAAEEPTPPPAPQAGPVSLNFVGAHQATTRLENGGSQPVSWETLTLAGVPGDLTVEFNKASFACKWPKGEFAWTGVSAIQHGSAAQRLPAPSRVPPIQWWDWMRERGFLGDSPLPGGQEAFDRYFKGPPTAQWDFYQSVPPDVAARMGREPSSMTLSLEGKVSRWSSLPEISLKEGASWQSGSEGALIAQTKWEAKRSTLHVTLIEHRARFGFGFNPWWDIQDRWYTAVKGNRLAALSQRGGEALEFRVGTVVIELNGLSFGLGRVGEAGMGRELGLDWFKGATLACSRQTVLGSFRREVEVDRFLAEPAGPAD